MSGVGGGEGLEGVHYRIKLHSPMKKLLYAGPHQLKVPYHTYRTQF